MKLVRLKLKNWLSFEELDYTFQDKALQIQGNNLTDDDQLSNGSGKSAIQSSIEKLILNSTSRKVTDVELINFEADKAELFLEIYCPFRQQTLIIERTISKKNSSTLNLRVHGKEVEFSTVRDGDNFINDWLGISKEDLQNYYLISKERFISFFSSPNSKKIELINRFSNASIINGVDGKVKEDIANVEQLIRSKEKEIDIIGGKIIANTEQLEIEEKRDLKEELNQRIDSLKTESLSIENEIKTRLENIKNFEQAIKIENSNIDDLKLKVETLGKDLNNSEIDNLLTKLEVIRKNKTDINNDILKKNVERQSYESVIDEVTNEIHKIERNLMGSVTCPKCKHNFILGKDVDIKKEEKKKAEFILMSKTAYENVQQISDRIESFKIENLEPLTQEEHNINLKIDELNSSVTKVKQEINNLNLKIQELEYNIVSHNRKIDNYNRAIKDFENSIVGIENEIKVLKEKPIKANPVVIEIKDKIKDLNNELKSRNSELEDLNNQLQEVTSWVFNFKRFQLYLAEKSIKVIQGNCNSYLNKMRSDLRVKVEGFKIKADKSIKEEITPYVLRGDKLRNFGSFSGGERGRMEYAMILALQNVINSTNKYGGLQFLMTDEAIEGLDSLGLDNVVESLQVFNFPILITTHIQNQKNFDNVLMVEKENGVSRILNN